MEKKHLKRQDFVVPVYLTGAEVPIRARLGIFGNSYK